MAAFATAPAVGVGRPASTRGACLLPTGSALCGALPARAPRPFRPSRRCRPVASLQSPDRDGPPDLEEYFAGKAAAAAAAAAGAAPAPPVALGTGRANTGACGGDAVAAGEAAATKALAALGEHATVADVVAVHVTADVGVDWTGLLTAAKEVLERLAAAGAAVPTFWLFASSGGAPAEAVRAGVEAATGGKAVVYGGPAAGDGRCVTGGVVPPGGSPPAVAVDLLGIVGGVSFIASAVVKTWAQPVFAEPLPYMTPTYTGDPSTDLLTAIRYNDMDTFDTCLAAGVDVNTQWADKQHQSPLLAACARARTAMVDVLLSRGADVGHRNDGGFTAVMYTRMLSGYDRPVVMGQLRALEAAGASAELTDEETTALDKATGGRIVPL